MILGLTSPMPTPRKKILAMHTICKVTRIVYSFNFKLIYFTKTNCKKQRSAWRLLKLKEPLTSLLLVGWGEPEKKILEKFKVNIFAVQLDLSSLCTYNIRKIAVHLIISKKNLSYVL